MTASPRFLIVGFDGLRPDCVTPEDMPALRRFLDEHQSWSKYCSSFPTETYVNHPSIFSGGRPNEHGLVANCFYLPSEKGEDAVFRGWSVPSVESLGSSSEGLFTLPTLGERLARAGRTLRVYCANSPGSTRLQHHRAGDFPGHLNVCAHDGASGLPAQEMEAITKVVGPTVLLKFPDFDGNDYLTRAFFEYEVPRGLGDVTVLWYGEPDHSSHEFGLWDERTVAGRRDADRAFAKILDWWEQDEKDGRAAGMQLIVLSDHGHGVVAKHADLLGSLRDAGFSVLTGNDVVKGADVEASDIVAVGTYTLGLWFREPTIENLTKARDALMSDENVGMIFSQPSRRGVNDVEGIVPGTFSEAIVSSDHPRGPHLRVVGRGNAATGELVMCPELSIGAGNHGGLLPQEIRAVLGAAGTAFPGTKHHETPAGHDDLAVTIMTKLHLFDDEAPLPLPKGRYLTETEEGVEEPDRTVVETLTLDCGEFRQYVKRYDHQAHRYVFEGGRGDGRSE